MLLTTRAVPPPFLGQWSSSLMRWPHIPCLPLPLISSTLLVFFPNVCSALQRKRDERETSSAQTEPTRENCMPEAHRTTYQKLYA